MLVRAHPRSSSHDLGSMHDGELAVRKWLEGQLRDPDLVELNRRRTEDVLARIAVLRARTGPLRPSVRHLMRAGLAERRLDWLLLACGLPLLRLPGRDRLLGLRRRLLHRPNL